MEIPAGGLETKVGFCVDAEPFGMTATVDTFYHGIAVLAFKEHDSNCASFLRKLVFYDTIEQFEEMLRKRREEDCYRGEWSVLYDQKPQRE